MNKEQEEKPICDEKELETIDDTPWYGVQLFGLKSKVLAEYLEETGVESFIPMHRVDYINREGKRTHELKPVVSNLMFIKKTSDDAKLVNNIDKCYKNHYYIIRKERGSREFYKIPARQMKEFMVMCNPNLLMTKYISEGEAKLKRGDRVIVTHGPLKGLNGRLVRSSGKYYLLKEIPGMAVMLKVTRWCCQKAED